ncbi:MAG TPA: DNA polymerase III subunit alpha [Pyrinomonadaceae bacterium]|nr:DNA polymerase III subunit alpha [Pyrinomonadaceae bacterium]
MTKEFVHLHLHTDYSLLESAIQLKPLAKRLKELNMNACAITDYGNMYGAVNFYNTMKANEIHPIIGYEAHVTFGSRRDRGTSLESGERPYYNLVLLAKDLEGYYNLSYLASKAFTEGMHYKPRIDLEILAEKSKGLVALSSGFKGFVWHHLKHGDVGKAEQKLLRLREIFGKDDFFLEIQQHDLEDEKKIFGNIVAFSKNNDIPLVATNDAHYLYADDARAHELLLCIGEGKTVNDLSRTTFGSDNFYVKSPEEMWQVFGADLPQSLNNSLKIAEMCRFKLPSGDNLALPLYPIPPDSGCQSVEEYFEKVTFQGFESRKRSVLDKLRNEGILKHPFSDYQGRLGKEIDIIRRMGFPGYFLIVWDFIQYAKRKGIPVGPGRGSAAGSLVAYCLEITDVDPLQYDLLFERFLNPERVSMPDIDIDFCVRGRAEVINHVTEVYGRDSVCQIATFGTMASKAAIKDVGRALNMPYADVEKIAKLIPPPVRGRNVSISQAMEQVGELRSAIETSEQVRELVDLARRLEGCARHTSVHAAGVVISPKPLHELVPTAVSAKNELTSQYTMTDLEKVGMLKMDFLALTTLTIINDCLISIKQRTGAEIDWTTVSLSDEKTMALFGEGRTEAVFQFESPGMQEICRRLKPKELEDLAALNALYRPGPLDGGMVDDFILRHRGEKRVAYIVPEMKDILSNTYGILVYQEQIMQLAQKLAGYTLGEADMMRRAMGKKKREEMAVHEEKFIQGAVARNIKREKAEEIFKLMAQFADYGFNRSHSVAYALLAFQTAYLKAHYSAYFYAAVLSNESQDTAKIYKYSTELRHAGLQLLPPDVNESDPGFTPTDDAVRFGLNAIKGIGSNSVQAIIEARRSGPFTSLYDFTTRIESGAVNRRGLESLITAGAFDSLKPSHESINLWRARLFAAIDSSLSMAQKQWNDKIKGQNALFGMEDTARASAGGDGDGGSLDAQLPSVPAWSQHKLSQEEKNAVGFYLSTHPLDDYKEILAHLKIRNILDFQGLKPGEKVTMAGIVSGAQARHSKKGNRFCIFKLEDQSTGAKCLAWADTFSKYAECLQENELLIINGKIESNEGQEMTVIVEDAQKLADALPTRAQKVLVTLPASAERFSEQFLDELFAMFSRNRGTCDVYFNLELDRTISVNLLSQPIRISGTKLLETELVQKGCRVEWQFS